jgi:hypothetical protein
MNISDIFISLHLNIKTVFMSDTPNDAISHVVKFKAGK